MGGIAAVVFRVIALRGHVGADWNGRNMAVAGIVLGIVSFVLSAAVYVVVAQWPQP